MLVVAGGLLLYGNVTLEKIKNKKKWALLGAC